MQRNMIIVALIATAIGIAGCGGGGGSGGEGEAIHSISGTVSSTGSGIEGVEVSAGGHSATTAGNGTYTIEDLVADTYAVSATRAGYAFEPTSQGVTVNETEGNATGVDFTAYQENVYIVFGEDDRVNQGGTTTVSIYLANPPATPAGYQMTIKYDASKLELAGGVGAVQAGAAVPASPNHIIAKNTSTGVVQVTVVGWNGSNIVNLSTTNNEILSIQFQSTGDPGVVAIDIDTTAGAPTQLQLWTSGASQIAPPTAVIDGTVTINP